MLWHKVHESNRPPQREAGRKLREHGVQGHSDAGEIFEFVTTVIKRVAVSPDRALFTEQPPREVVREDLDADETPTE
jgi:hypothetical protein